MISYDLLAYEYYKNQYVPNETYTSGQRTGTEFVDKYTNVTKTPALLILEEDIVDKDGKGLKRGFYNVAVNKYKDMLLLYQSGQLKARVPVVSYEVYETLNPKQQKPKKMSQKKYEKLKQKEYRKHLKGITPEEVDYKNVEIFKSDKGFLIIYQEDNVEFRGIISL